MVRLGRCAGTRDFYPALAALVSPVQNSFFFIVQYTISIFASLSPSNFDSGHAVVKGRLSLNMCLRVEPWRNLENKALSSL